MYTYKLYIKLYHINMKNGGGNRKSASPCRFHGPPKDIHISHLLSESISDKFWMFCGPLLSSTFDEILYFVHHLFEHDLCIDCSSILGWILASLLMFLLIPFPFAHATF